MWLILSLLLLFGVGGFIALAGGILSNNRATFGFGITLVGLGLSLVGQGISQGVIK
jgi:hypothetical protein